MKILALDTATEACSAALYDDGCLLERYQVAPREHANLILPMVDELLAEAGYTLRQMDGLGFGRGPGAFTGLRIAAGVVQGIALGADLPVVPVSTLAALALEAFGEVADAWAFPCIDARMGEVYWGVYQRDETGLPQLWGEERVCPAEAVLFPGQERGAAIGSGWAAYGGALANRAGGAPGVLLQERFPRAGCVARLAARDFSIGRQVSPELALPVYLRDDVAKKPGQA